MGVFQGGLFFWGISDLISKSVKSEIVLNPFESIFIFNIWSSWALQLWSNKTVKNISIRLQNYARAYFQD